MLRSLSIIFLSLIICLLSACNAIKQHNEEEALEKQKKVKIAKINAQLGIAYLEQNNIQRAKRKLILALDQAPLIPETWYSMAYFYEATGERMLAKQHYQKAIAIAPKRGDTHNNYGTFLCRSGEFKAAINQFLQAVNDADYLNPAAAYENAGLCAMRIPNEKQAAYFFNQALLQDPNRPVALYKLANFYYQKGNFKAASIKLQQFMAIAPSSPQSIALRERIEKKLQDEELTRQALLAAKINTNKPKIEVKTAIKNNPQTKKIVASKADSMHNKIVKSLKEKTGLKLINDSKKETNAHIIAHSKSVKTQVNAKLADKSKKIPSKNVLTAKTINKKIADKNSVSHTQSTQMVNRKKNLAAKTNIKPKQIS